MKPCENCKDSPGSGRTCYGKIMCDEWVEWLRDLITNERDADPQEERGLDHMIDDREA
jgi:hypothetical protein